jgi:hypothetical protein
MYGCGGGGANWAKNSTPFLFLTDFSNLYPDISSSWPGKRDQCVQSSLIVVPETMTIVPKHH